MNNQELWQSVLNEIELQVSRPNFLTWFKQSQLLGRDEKEGLATIGLPNNFAKEWVKNRYHKLLLGSLRNYDSSIRNIEYKVSSPHTAQKPVSEVKITPQTENPQPVPQIAPPELKQDPFSNLNPKYTLRSFIVGPSNELAYAAIQAVIRDVGKKYNPLFIYGGVGLGKTHLIQAAGNEIRRTYQDKTRVMYVSSEKFINDVVWAVRNHRMDDVKKRYRDIDVLIVDDIQFIGGKPTTEQEFFYTFNALYENNKQIIISSDRPPASIPTLEERLRSRFEGGMIVDVSYPDYEMRLAILKTKIQEQNISLPDEILESLASKVQKNVRELEGTLKKVLFFLEHKKEPLTLEKLEETLSGEQETRNPTLNANHVITVVAEFFSISSDDLMNRCRKKEVVEPRQICMYLLRDLLKLSYPFIGEKLGKRDHTTAIHAFEKISKELTHSQSLNQKVSNIKNKLTAKTNA